MSHLRFSTQQKFLVALNLAILQWLIGVCANSANEDATVQKAIKDFGSVCAKSSYCLAARPQNPNDDYKSLLSSGNLLYLSGRFRAALNQYDLALKIKPNCSTGYVNRACAQFGLGKKALALEDLNRAIEIDPSGWLAYFNRACYLDSMEASANDYKRSLLQESNSQEACFYIQSRNPNPQSQQGLNQSKLQPVQLESRTKFAVFQNFPNAALPVFSDTKTGHSRSQSSSDVEVLMNSHWFADGVSPLEPPLGAKDIRFVAFQTVLTAHKPFESSLLKSLIKRSTPSGQLYFAILLRNIDPSLGLLELQRLADSPEPLEYRQGCMVLTVTVGQIATKFLSDNVFRAFLASESPIPLHEIICFKQSIERARKFSQASVLVDLPRYPQIGGGTFREKISFIPTATLKELGKSATPAGKLYLASIMQKYDRNSGNAALALLSKEQTKITYSSEYGSKVYTISEIARSLVTTGRFQSFEI